MIKYKKVEQLLSEKGISKTTLRRKYKINLNQLNDYIKKGYSGGLVDNLCRALNCQPGDFLEYVPDKADDPNDNL